MADADAITWDAPSQGTAQNIAVNMDKQGVPVDMIEAPDGTVTSRDVGAGLPTSYIDKPQATAGITWDAPQAMAGPQSPPADDQGISWDSAPAPATAVAPTPPAADDYGDQTSRHIPAQKFTDLQPGFRKDVADALNDLGGKFAANPASAVPGSAEALAAGTVGFGSTILSGLASLANVGGGVEQQAMSGGTEQHSASQDQADGLLYANKALEPLANLMAPETDFGKSALGAMGVVFGAPHAAAEASFEAHGSPAAAATIEGLGNVLMALIPMHKVGKAEAVAAPRSAADTLAGAADHETMDGLNNVDMDPKARAADAARVGKDLWDAGHVEEAVNFMQGAADDITAGRPIDVSPESLKATRTAQTYEGETTEPRPGQKLLSGPEQDAAVPEPTSEVVTAQPKQDVTPVESTDVGSPTQVPTSAKTASAIAVDQANPEASATQIASAPLTPVRGEVTKAQPTASQIQIDHNNVLASLQAIAAAPVTPVGRPTSAPDGVPPEVHAQAAGDVTGIMLHIADLTRQAKVTPPDQRVAIEDQIVGLRRQASAAIAAHGAQYGPEAGLAMHTLAAESFHNLKGSYKPAMPAVQESPAFTPSEQTPGVNSVAPSEVTSPTPVGEQPGGDTGVGSAGSQAAQPTVEGQAAAGARPVLRAPAGIPQKIVKGSIDEAAHEAAASPNNDRLTPSQGQSEVSNYKHGHGNVGGVPVAFENPAGSVRMDKTYPPKWATVMDGVHYGRMKGTEAADVHERTGQPQDLDVMVANHLPFPEKYNGAVNVINQVNPHTGAFDETKTMIGPWTPEQAKAMYLRQYPAGWKGVGSVVPTTMDGLRQWLASGDTKGPFKAADTSAQEQGGTLRVNNTTLPDRGGVSGLAPEHQILVAGTPSQLVLDYTPSTRALRADEQDAVANWLADGIERLGIDPVLLDNLTPFVVRDGANPHNLATHRMVNNVRTLILPDHVVAKLVRGIYDNETAMPHELWHELASIWKAGEGYSSIEDNAPALAMKKGALNENVAVGPVMREVRQAYLASPLGDDHLMAYPMHDEFWADPSNPPEFFYREVMGQLNAAWHTDRANMPKEYPLGYALMKRIHDAAANEITVETKRRAAAAVLQDAGGAAESEHPATPAAVGLGARDDNGGGAKGDRNVIRGAISDQRRLRVDSPALGSESPLGKNVSVDDVAQHFDELARARGGPFDYNNPKHFKAAVKQATAEFGYQLKQARSGLDWYEGDIKSAYEITAKHIPELEDAVHRQLFSVVAALLSPEIKANKNWSNAAEAYQHYVKTGSIPEVNPVNNELWSAKTGRIKAQALTHVNAMLDDMGREAAVEWLLSDHSVAELNDNKQQYGVYKTRSVAGKMADRQLGVYIFGEKVGPFALNINGINTEVTVDKWMTRTFNRYFGTLADADGKSVETPSEQQRRAIKELVNQTAAATGYKPSQVQSVLWFYEQQLYNRLGAGSVSTSFSDGAKDFANANELETAGPGHDESGSGTASPAASPGQAAATIHDFSEDPEAALKKPGWAILTAHKDGISSPANTTARNLLIADLKAGGIEHYPISGSYRGKAEPDSSLAFTTPDKALALAKKYGQESILTSKGLEYTDGRLQPADHAQTLTGEGAEDRDFHSVLPNGTAFSMGLHDMPDVSSQEQRAPFHSGLERAVAAKAPFAKDGTVSAEQLRAWLAGRAKDGVVKPQELAWSGLDDYLKLEGGKVTRDQVQKFLDQNGVKVEEHVLGGAKTVDDIPAKIIDGVKEYHGVTDEQWRRFSDEKKQDFIEEFERDTGTSADAQDTKYHAHQLPGGKNYRELLLTLPQGEGSPKYEALRQQADALRNRKRGEVLPDGRTVGDTIDSIYAQQAALQDAPGFQSSHFDQPHILAHVRFNERTDANGKKVLFIEELQSDWAQKGRKEGFGSTRAAIVQDSGQWKVLDSEGRQWGPLHSSHEDAAKAASKLGGEFHKILGGVPSAPFVGKTEAWTALALKRMIRYAAENSFDRVAWTNGEQQAARYDLSKQVDGITAKKWENGKVGIVAKDLQGQKHSLGEFDPEKLEGVIGKDLASKVLADLPNMEHGQVKNYFGSDLKVGGEGMKSFYDKIVPNVANDVLRKLGGGKVYADEAGVRGTGSPYMYVDPATGERAVRPGSVRVDNPDYTPKQQGFDITPALRERATVDTMEQFQRRPTPKPEAVVERQPLTGLPKSSPGPFEPARAVADMYMQEVGLPYDPPTNFVRVDPMYAKRIAFAYDMMEHAPADDHVAAAYQALADETVAQWHAMKTTGIDIRFADSEHPYPYAVPSEAVADVRDNGRLWVYPTDEGFGSSGKDVSDNPLLAKTDIKVGGRQLMVNDVFRAVHDYFGHVKEGLGFRADGEENAWRQHAAMFSPLAREAMTSETRGQNSWLNYGPHGDVNRTAKQADTIYADQKAGLLPKEFTEDRYADAGRESASRDQQIAEGRPDVQVSEQRTVKGLDDSVARQPPPPADRGIGDAFRKWLAPSTRGPLAERQAGIIRHNLAKQARDRELAFEQLKGFGKMFYKMPRPERYAFIDAMERGLGRSVNSDNPVLTEAAQAIADLLDNRRHEIAALGTGKLENFIINYFPHIWQDPKKAATFFGGRRPLEGPKNFLKQRHYTDFMDGIAAGLKPITSNPAELALLKAREMDRYLYGQRIAQASKDAGLWKLLPWESPMPDGFTAINDKIAMGGSAGRWVAPDEAARLINNHLSPGLQGNSAYRMIRSIGNMLNSAQLGLSAFHVGFTTADSMISKSALGVMQLSRGDFIHGVTNIAQGMLNPAQPFVNLYKGDRLLRAYLGDMSDPSMTPILRVALASGVRVRMDDFYRNGAVKDFRQALQEGQYVRAGRAFLPSVMDAVMWPVMQWLVPRQKLGVFFDMAKDLLEQHPDMSDAEMEARGGRLWDSVDNRLGQMVYDNIFWDRAVKDIAMIAVRSVGWNWGTFRELGGGIKDLLDVKAIKKEGGLSSRTAYFVALVATTALWGAIINYLNTGQGPKELKDYFFPRTGKTRADGSIDRESLPTYMKDVASYGHDVSGFLKYGADPTQTLRNKMAPQWSMLNQMLTNKDFFGAAIRSPGDPAFKQLMDEAKFIGSQATPMGIRNYLQQSKTAGTTPNPLGYVTSAPFVGVTPSPGYITKSDAQTESSAISNQKDALMAKFRQEIRDGEPVSDVHKEMRDAGLTATERSQVVTQASRPQHPPKTLRQLGR